MPALPDLGLLFAGEALALVQLAVAGPAGASHKAVVRLECGALPVLGLVAARRLAEATLAAALDLQGALNL